MQKLRFKTKILTVFLLLSLFSIALYRTYANGAVLISGSNFNIETAGSIGFQSQYTLDMEVTSGIMNGTNGKLGVTMRTGSLSFDSYDDCTLELSSADAPQGFRLDTSGVESTAMLGDFVYETVFKSGKRIVLTWSWNQPSFVDIYFMLGVGLSGIIMMIFAPTWVAFAIIHKAYDAETAKRFGMAMLIFIIGFGMVVCWLWPGGT